MSADYDPDARDAWRAPDLARDPSWRFQIDEKAAAHLAAVVKATRDPDRPGFDYAPEDFDLGPAAKTIHAAFAEALHGCGLAHIKGLPRAGMSEPEFRVLNWAIGLHVGVARPQGKASQYISPVRDAGTDYRSASGRGYSSNAKLDFHVDGADVGTLSCYNAAKAGGETMFSSGVTAYGILAKERPDLAEVARQDFYFSRQHEEAPDEGLFYGQPLIDFADGKLFAKWNRNRVQSAQRFQEAARLSDAQLETMDAMDEILRRPEVMLTMRFEPGDLLVFANHAMLHSRTDYEDFDEPDRKRLLWRLWLAPPDSPLLPESWRDFFRRIDPGTVRGGIRGHHHDAACQAFDAKQAARLGMPAP